VNGVRNRVQRPQGVARGVCDLTSPGRLTAGATLIRLADPISGRTYWTTRDQAPCLESRRN